MSGRKRDDTINVRVSAQGFAFDQIASIAEAVKTEVARKIVETAAAEKETNDDEQKGD